MKIRDFYGEFSIFLYSLLIRLPLLGWDIFNTDSSSWKARSYVFSTEFFSFHFAETARTTHPGVTLMWIGTVAIKFYHLVNRLFRPGIDLASREELFVFHFTVKLGVVLVLSLLLTLSFSLLKRRLGFWGAFFAVFILSLEPFFLAHTRVYHLDGLLAMFSFAAILFLLNFLFDKSHCRFLLGAAVFSSLAALTKLSGLFLLPFASLLLGFGFFKKRFSLEEMLKSFAIYLLVFVIVFFVFWPAMWVAPVKTLILYFSGIFQEGFGGHRQVVLGHQTMDPGIIFYPLSLAIRLSPYLLTSAVFGIYQLIKVLQIFPFYRHSEPRSLRSLGEGERGEESPGVERLSGWDSSVAPLPQNDKKCKTLELIRCFSTRRKSSVTAVLSASLIFIFLYLVFITIPSKKMERYTVPVYPFIAVLAGVGLSRVKRGLDSYLKGGGLLLIPLLSLFFVLSAGDIHPDYLAYYSPLVGGYSSGTRFIYPRWHFGDAQLGRYLNSREGAENLTIACYNHDQLPPFVLGKVISLGRDTDQSEADYIVIPVWRVEREQELQELYNLELETVTTVGKNPVYRVFRVVKDTKL